VRPGAKPIAHPVWQGIPPSCAFVSSLPRLLNSTHRTPPGPQELGAILEYFSVAQRICLYLARISPQQTIDHLVYEVSLGLHEDYSATETTFIGGAGG
jgi:hypothetical protein